MRSVFVWFCLFVTILTNSATAQPNLTIQAVRLGVQPNGATRLVLDVSHPLPNTAFRAESQNGGRRIILELPPFIWRVNTPESKGMVRALTPAARHAGARIVIDMTGPVEIEALFTLPRLPDKPHRLVLDVVPLPSKALAPPPKPYIYKIVLDSGHGGKDPGAIFENIKEKDITLHLAQELARQLRKTGRYDVFLTRTEDKALALADRVAFARAKKADLFISLHADSISKPFIRGTSVYTLSEKASDAQTADLAAKENRADSIAGLDLTLEDPQVASILIDLSLRDSTNKAGFLAESLIKSFAQKNVAVLENPHRYAGFAVLKAPDIPSVLIEAGFLSNKEEAKALSDPKHRAHLASAMFEGIDTYFKRIKTLQNK